MLGKVFEPQDFEAFLALLPDRIVGQALRHVIDVRRESFMTPECLALARRYRVATVFADAEKFPSFADLAGYFAYDLLMLSDAALDAWSERTRCWAAGNAPADLPSLQTPAESFPPRDVFIYFINGAKECAPAAAMALLARLGLNPASAAQP